MKGDFTRSTFDARKHYSGIRLQQGRVHIDADWNEQVDIFRYALEAQLRDLLGPAGTTAAQPGFALSIGDRPTNGGEPPARDMLIAPGHYYVDGLLAESDAPTWFAAQPDYPGAALPADAADGADYLVYLDVWQRHITFIEDPDLREVALDGPDTATRTKTIWQIKLLPLAGDAAAQPPEEDQTPLAELAAWRDFVTRSAAKGQLEARRVARAQLPQNQLYRVEIHSADSNGATFKWSRENGSVAFPIIGMSIPKAAASAPHGAAPAQPAPAADPQQFTVTLEYLERDKLYLNVGDWVEIEDDDGVLRGEALPLCRVHQLDLVEGQDDQLGQMHGEVILDADAALLAKLWSAWSQPGGGEGARRKHILLRRWDQCKPDSAAGPAQAASNQCPNGLVQMLPDQWQALEYGIEIRFTGGGAYAPGDYWLIPSRTQQQTPRWPPRPPDGIAHHYAPLARLAHRAGAWQIMADAAPQFEALPKLTADSRLHQQGIDALRRELEQIEIYMAELQAEMEELRKAAAVARTRLSVDFRSDAELEIGDLVAFVPSLNEHVERASRDNEALVAGVVTGHATGEHHAERHYRVAVHGRAKCRVIGDVRPGDLLVAAEAAGCARRAGLYIQPGTIIGKAIDHHKPQRADAIGLIDILITLG